jgi:Glycosyl hydrolases family 2, TIM barrel domain
MRTAVGKFFFPVRLTRLDGLASQLPVLLLVLGVGISGGCNRESRGGLTQDHAIGVHIRKIGDGWELTRNGNPYFVRGAGGDGSKELLAKLGGNSVRTWGTDALQQKLDEAQKHGLTLAVGIWLGHERHGFNYNDPAQVARQKEKVSEAVTRFKDHPAVLLWGLGNEMEGYGKGDNPAVWKAVNDLALLVKRLDPNHPTMTVVAEIGGDRVQSIHRLCPAIDIVGINSYAGAPSLPQRYRDAGGKKPYILTEFGPPGSWEVSKTPWGAALEPSSTEKALFYRRAYQKAVVDAKGLCLGSYAFIFGNKQETTATWFGMLLPDGTRLAAADVMSSLWTRITTSNRCPRIERLSVEGPTDVAPDTVIKATLAASDPENDPLTVRWSLQADPVSHTVGGDAEPAPPAFPSAIRRSTSQQVEVRMPSRGGSYRLFAYVYDGQAGAAVANIPLHVKDPIKEK